MISVAAPLCRAGARSTVAVMVEPTPTRVSHERIPLASLSRSLEDIEGIEVFTGQGGGNRFGLSGWELTLGQQFQFGDLRVETPTTTVVIEVESGGGIGNLAKYWPLLPTGAIGKRFVYQPRLPARRCTEAVERSL